MTENLTPQNAPRDPAALYNIGAYQLRVLMGALGMLSAPEEMQAWHTMNQQQRVDAVLAGLRQWDAQNGGAPQAAPVREPPQTAAQPMGTPPRPGIPLPPGLPNTGVRTPPQPPAVQHMQPSVGVNVPVPPHVNGAAQNGVAGPAMAAPNTKAPRVKREPPPPAETGAVPVETGVALFNDVLAQSTAMMEENKRLNAQVTALIKTQTKDVNGKALEEINGGLKTLSRTLSWLLTLSVIQAEQTTGMSRVEILQAMLGDAEALRQMVDAAASGGKY